MRHALIGLTVVVLVGIISGAETAGFVTTGMLMTWLTYELFTDGEVVGQ